MLVIIDKKLKGTCSPKVNSEDRDDGSEITPMALSRLLSSLFEDGCVVVVAGDDMSLWIDPCDKIPKFKFRIVGY